MVNIPSAKIKVSDFMTKKVVSVSPEMFLSEAAQILSQNSFNGVPVVDDKNKLLGILTEYDLIQRGSSLHIPTFLKLIKEFEVYRKDRQFIDKELKKILSVKVKEAMNRDPLAINFNASIEEAARLFSEHHKVNPIIVIDENNVVVGIISRCDIIQLYAPSLDHPSASELLRSNVSDVLFNKASRPKSFEKNVDDFLNRFEQKFVLVRKSRTRFWLLLSAAFFIAGFIVALFSFLKFKIRINF